MMQSEQEIKFEDKHGDTFVFLHTGQENCDGCVFDEDDEGCESADSACCFLKGIWKRD